MKKVLFLLTGVLLLVGCSENGTQTADTDSPGGLQTDLSIDILESQRHYHLYVPQNPKTAQIVLLLHGNRGSADQILGLNGLKAPNALWLDIAQRENLILIVPDGAVGREGHQGWNDCRTDALNNPDTDDVLFISTLIDKIAAEYQTAQRKVFSVGVSNGGIMSMRLADEIPNKLHAFAALVASRPVNTECPDTVVPVSALFMNGTDDPILPYEGGHIRPKRGELYSTHDAVAYWVNRNQTNNTTGFVELADINTSDNSSVKVQSYDDGSNNTRVMHYEIVGGGHNEPSIEHQYALLWKRITGEQNNDIESAEEIWDFFSSLKQ